jgi:hypothetical protein
MLTHHGFKLEGPLVYSIGANFSNNDLTPSVKLANIYQCATGHSAARTITNFDDALTGHLLIIKGANPTYKTTIQDGTYLKLTADWVEATNNMLVLIKIGTVWLELCRSANA